MTLIVQKFGGTSVGNLESIQRVAKIIRDTRAQGHDVIAVVSAMQGETDRLINLAKAATDQPTEREFDALISTGEQVSAALLSMTLNASSCPACSYTGGQAQIRTDKTHRKARIIEINPTTLQHTLAQGQVPVVTGFQGVNDDGHITTIGRGGSDVTAVVIAAIMHADECQIYTDVDGVYTTDPRVVKGARRLNQISFDEMLEFSSQGAKVLQRKAVEYAFDHLVPVRVLSSFEQGPGTLITQAPSDLDQPLVSGIAFSRDQAKLSILGLPNHEGVSLLIDELSQADLDVDMMVQNAPTPESKVDFSFTVHMDDYDEALAITERVSHKMGVSEVLGDKAIAKLSVVGLGMKTHASVAAKMLHSLDQEGITIQLITSSEVKISTVIADRYMELGARILHAAFELDRN